MAEDIQSPEWSKEKCQFEPGANLIDIWRVNLLNSELDGAQGCLAEDERQRAAKFVLDDVRNTFVRSRCALRLILSRCLSQTAASIKFRFGEQGKPTLISSAADYLHFNLSHTGSIALVAVARDRRVGIDVNDLNRTTDWKPIAKRSFSSTELSQLLKLPEIDQRKVFHRIWTQKEAYTKAVGDGYSYGFQKFSVVVDTDGDAGLLHDENNPQAAQAWNITAINAGSDQVAAMAYDGTTVTRIRQWEFCNDQERNS